MGERRHARSIRRSASCKSTTEKDIELHKSILREFGHEFNSDTMILDFGCGDGRMVRQYRNAGFKAFGVDVVLPNEGQFLHLISSHGDYHIPFSGNSFDFVFSNSVLEHVEKLASALSEIYRVLKPGGASLHIFPSAAKPIEPHVFVPFGGVLRNRAWLHLWASLGIRNSFQKDLDFLEVARKNYVYLHNHTFYRNKRELRAEIYGQFRNLSFADKEMIKHSYGRARYIFPFVKAFPPLASIYGAFHNRCIFFEKLNDS